MRSVSSLTFQICLSGARSKRDGWLMALASEQIHNPEKQRKSEAHDHAGGNREIETPVSALIGNIAGQATQAKWQPPAKDQKGACADQHDADNEQQLTDFAQRIHASVC